LLLALSLGCLLLKTDIDHKLEASITSFRFNYDLAGIEKMITDNEITRGSDEHSGLFIAAWMNARFDLYSDPMPWTDLARELGEKSKPRLPSARFFKEPKRNPFAVWSERNLLNIEKFFYAVSVASLFLLLLSILVR
jgi:hypothetical protein